MEVPLQIPIYFILFIFIFIFVLFLNCVPLKASSPCSVNNGGCSHFCVAKTSGYECVCPTGLAVKQDGKTCKDRHA